MKKIKISITIINELREIKIDDFYIENNFSYSAFIDIIRFKLLPFLRSTFLGKKVFIENGDKFISLSESSAINSSSDISIYYIDLVKVSNAAHIDWCYTHNKKGKIIFDVFPNELNHRYTPHTNAFCCGETIRITISQDPQILGNIHFTGNNQKNEQIAINHVKKKYDFFIEKWEEFVESQFL